MVDPELGMARIDRQGGEAVGEGHVIHPEFRREVLELTVPVGNAERADVVPFSEQKFEDRPAEGGQPVGVGDHVEALLGRGGTRGDEFPVPVPDLDQAEPTRADWT